MMKSIDCSWKNLIKLDYKSYLQFQRKLPTSVYSNKKLIPSGKDYKFLKKRMKPSKKEQIPTITNKLENFYTPSPKDKHNKQNSEKSSKIFKGEIREPMFRISSNLLIRIELTRGLKPIKRKLPGIKKWNDNLSEKFKDKQQFKIGIFLNWNNLPSGKVV